MTRRKTIYRAIPDHPAELRAGEASCFPIHFMDDPEYTSVDRAVGIWLSLGLTVTVKQTEVGYRLILDHPEAVPTAKT